MKRERVAAIDIGTNSIRCIVVEMDRMGTYRVLDDEKATVRLGEGITRNNTISPDAWRRAAGALALMKKLVDGYSVVGIEAVATSAVRTALNGEAFVRDIADTIGLDITIISGEEEAEFVTLSALYNFDMAGNRFVMVDIGGGSVEIVTAVGSHVEEVYSLDLGAVFLTDTFIGSDPVRAGDYLKLHRHIRKSLRKSCGEKPIPVQRMVGSGGTITAVAAMIMAMRKEQYSSVHGYEILRSDIVHLHAVLLRKDLKERTALQGLNPERADIIVAGVTLLNELMGHFSANILLVNERGLRGGLVLKALRTHGFLPQERKARSWKESLLEFGRACHFDEMHAAQVARLSLQIFDAIAAPFSLEERNRRLLEAAALLHDVGYLISYSGHHKHTYHLIRHADLFGFNPLERELIAHVARYHRKSPPKNKHENFSRLSHQDRTLVSRLGGILRLADGLDRRRNSLVTALECSLSPVIFMVRLHSKHDVSVEVFGGKTKGDLFEAAFSRKLVLVDGTSDERAC